MLQQAGSIGGMAVALIGREGRSAGNMPVRPAYAVVVQKILVRCVPGDEGCWIWTGAKDSRGYGRFRPPPGAPKVSSLVHRAVYTAMIEDPDPLMHLDHLCRNRLCCNPGHLDLVSPRVNLTRGLGPVSERARAKVCVAGHRFDEANTYITKAGRRMCRKCNARRQRETKARRLARQAAGAGGSPTVPLADQAAD